MKSIKKLFFVPLLTFYFGTTFSQTADSLNVSPNPFNDSATIHFEISQSDTITLSVLSSFGELMETYFDATILPSGPYNINLSGDNLIDGYYFIILDIGSTKTITQKVLKSGSTSGIANNKLFDKVLVYPNPTNDQVVIPITGNKKIMITNLNGKILKAITTDQQIISLSDIPTGQYIITILTNKNEIITSQKIQKCE